MYLETESTRPYNYIMTEYKTHWFDDKIKPTVMVLEDGTVAVYYCPYIPKFLVGKLKINEEVNADLRQKM